MRAREGGGPAESGEPKPTRGGEASLSSAAPCLASGCKGASPRWTEQRLDRRWAGPPQISTWPRAERQDGPLKASSGNDDAGPRPRFGPGRGNLLGPEVGRSFWVFSNIYKPKRGTIFLFGRVFFCHFYRCPGGFCA